MRFVARLSRLLLAAMLFGVSLLAPTGNAAADDNRIASNSSEFSLAIGYGRIDSPIVQRDALEFYLLPQFAWYGERGYFENGLFGVALQETPSVQFDAVLYPSDDGLLFNLSRGIAPFLNGPSLFPVPDHLRVVKTPERKIATMAGLRLAGQGAGLEWTLQAGADVASVHNGWELALRATRPRLWQQGDFQLGAEAGVALKSAELVDYYYMPRAGEIDPAEGDQYLVDQRYWVTVGPYRGRHGYRSHVQLQAQYALTERLAVLISYRHNWLSSALTDTPLIDAAEYGAAFGGLQYRF